MPAMGPPVPTRVLPSIVQTPVIYGSDLCVGGRMLYLDCNCPERRFHYTSSWRKENSSSSVCANRQQRFPPGERGCAGPERLPGEAVDKVPRPRSGGKLSFYSRPRSGSASSIISEDAIPRRGDHGVVTAGHVRESGLRARPPPPPTPSRRKWLQAGSVAPVPPVAGETRSRRCPSVPPAVQATAGAVRLEKRGQSRGS